MYSTNGDISSLLIIDNQFEWIERSRRTDSRRVINGGGTLEREYAIGRDRMDLCLRYGEVTLGIELKVWRHRKVDPLSKRLSQLDEYLARLMQDSGWLVIFARRENAPELKERLKTETHTTPSGRKITVIRA